jgi:hypothetical protein
MTASKEEASDEDIVRNDVAFVFDTSGSMSGAKIDPARRAPKAALNLMNPGDGVYLLALSSSTNPYLGATRELDEPLRVDASSFVGSVDARGRTNIHNGRSFESPCVARSEVPKSAYGHCRADAHEPNEAEVREECDAADDPDDLGPWVHRGLNKRLSSTPRRLTQRLMSDRYLQERKPCH